MKREPKETAGARGFRLGAAWMQARMEEDAAKVRADAVYAERMEDDLKEKKRKAEDND